jgi:tRNA threonylcarbamoyladenosine biosynthesis protein TsaE
MTVEIKSLEDLKRFAADFAGGLRGGDVVGLVGNLGVGKTTFVQQVALELGVSSEVKSPTFILVREYGADPKMARRNIRQVIHADAYRLDDEDELWAIGFDELADDPESVVFVEWADRVPSLRDYSSYRELKFSFIDENTRVIEY